MKEVDKNSNDTTITEKTFTEGDIKSQRIEKDADGNIISKVTVKADGSTITAKYENGQKVSSETKYEDGTSLTTKYERDEKGNKIGATTNRYDENGNLQTISTAKYDAETGRKTYGKTVDAEGNIKGEAHYEYQDHADGSYSQFRYALKDGEKTLTTTTAFNKNNVKESALNHETKTIETFKSDSEGNTTSSVKKSSSGNILSEETYDKNGNVTKIVEYTENGEIASETTFEYYDNGTEKSKSTKNYVIKETNSSNEVASVSSEEIKVAKTNTENSTGSPSTIGGNGEVSQELRNALDKRLGAGFCDKIEYVAKELNCDPEDLLAMMYSESGIDPQCGKGQGKAVGLIQFMPSTAEAYGYTPDQLTNMSAVEQLDVVLEALQGSKRVAQMDSNAKVDTGTLYSLCFLPAVANNEVLCSTTDNLSWAYNANKGLDIDKNGDISKTDLQERLNIKKAEMYKVFVG